MPEAETWRYRGQTIDREQIAFQREFIRAHPHSSRWKLSRQLCEALGWDLLPGGELGGVGANHGRGKDDQTHRPNRSIKEVLALPLHRQFHELLREGK